MCLRSENFQVIGFVGMKLECLQSQSGSTAGYVGYDFFQMLVHLIDNDEQAKRPGLQVVPQVVRKVIRRLS